MTDLSFSLLDDLCLAAQRNKLRGTNKTFRVTSLGVALELLLFSDLGRDRAINESVTLEFSSLKKMVDQITLRDKFWIAPQFGDMGFVRSSENNEELSDEWIRLGIAAQKCAASVGIPRPTAARLVGALGELRSNIFEHSDNPDSGLIAFQAHADGMEFVVADRGVGLLKSLRQNPEFTDLNDHGAALRTALTDGCSKYGSHAGRGLGFRAVFLGLANAVGELRFRTGDHVLVTAGESPSLITAALAQKAYFDGVLVQIRWRSSRVSMRQS